MLKKALILFLVLCFICCLTAQRRQDPHGIWSINFDYDIPAVHSISFPGNQTISFPFVHHPGQAQMYTAPPQIVNYFMTSTSQNATMQAMVQRELPPHTALFVESTRPPGAAGQRIRLTPSWQNLMTNISPVQDLNLNFTFEMTATGGAPIGRGDGVIHFQIIGH